MDIIMKGGSRNKHFLNQNFFTSALSNKMSTPFVPNDSHYN